MGNGGAAQSLVVVKGILTNYTPPPTNNKTQTSDWIFIQMKFFERLERKRKGEREGEEGREREGREIGEGGGGQREREGGGTAAIFCIHLRQRQQDLTKK